MSLLDPPPTFPYRPGRNGAVRRSAEIELNIAGLVLPPLAEQRGSRQSNPVLAQPGWSVSSSRIAAGPPAARGSGPARGAFAILNSFT
jgi:hypothetical protein